MEVEVDKVEMVMVEMVEEMEDVRAKPVEAGKK